VVRVILPRNKEVTPESILQTGIITASLNSYGKASINSRDFHTKTIHENERVYIIAVLKKCNGRIWGAGRAAEILNIPPATLTSTM
jgi:hypothetical protein